MSRSGYSDDIDGATLGLWRGTIKVATRGKRGQKFFRDLAAALDAMPVKRLISNEIIDDCGEVCAFGALGVYRGMSSEKLGEFDPEDPADLAGEFDVAECLARETTYENDEGGTWRDGSETPEQRWTRVRAWVEKQITKPGAAMRT